MGGGGVHHSQLYLLVDGRGQVELGQGLPLLRGADAVVRELLHGDPVDALRMADPVVHL